MGDIGGIIFMSANPRKYDEEDTTFLAMGLDTIGSTLGLVGQSQASNTDPLSGVFLRRVFEGRATAKFRAIQADDRDRILALAEFDADGFKSVNDIYGHQA